MCFPAAFFMRRGGLCEFLRKDAGYRTGRSSFASAKLANGADLLGGALFRFCSFSERQNWKRIGNALHFLGAIFPIR